MIIHKNNSGYTSRNKARLVQGGKEYFETLLRMINHAKFSIHFQTYIFINDETGSSVSNALMLAARRGVRVFMLLDGYASQDLDNDFIKELKSSGVLFRWFEPFLKSKHFYFGRRLHHKVIVIDGIVSMVGGINICDRYNDMPGSPGWMDWAIYTEGEVNNELFYVCQSIWNKSGWGRKKAEIYNENPLTVFPEDDCLVRIRRNDWVRNKNEITKSYLRAISESHSKIIIMASYFLPELIFKKALQRAIKKGVKIKLIVTGRSDVYLAKHAERHVYRWLLKNNVELYEYVPTILHGKLCICDAKWMTIGSYNVNNISAHVSIELNMDVLNEKFVKEAEARLEGIIEKDCLHITEEKFISTNNFFKRLWQEICYDIVRIIFYVSTFYFKQEDTKES